MSQCSVPATRTGRLAKRCVSCRVSSSAPTRASITRPLEAPRSTAAYVPTSAARLADDQLGLEQDLLVGVAVRVVALLEEQLGGDLAELVGRLADRAEGHGGGRGELDVVVSEERDVLGDPYARLLQDAEDAEGEQVVRAEDGVRWPLAQQRLGGDLTAVRVHRRHHDVDEVVRRPAGRIERPQRTPAPVAALADGVRAAHEGEAPGTAREKVAGRELAAGHVVHRDRAHVAGGVVVDEHDRDPAVAEPAQAGGVVRRRSDARAADPLFGQYPKVARLLLRRLAGVADYDGVVAAADDVLDSARDVDEERVAHVEHDEPDRAALPGPQGRR